MKSFIKMIEIFDKENEKRIVPLKEGVNIITGESKTGKSALVEIIDYCLCSTRCTIPKGKITDFSYLYVLVMEIGDACYVIARYSWDAGGRMYVCKENIDFEAIDLQLSYFDDKTLLGYKDAQNEIECALGLFVTNMIADSETKGKKASLRNMVSYLFQHQNLMASKFALFYRFSDFYKRKDVIEQFPVFAGIIGQEYYSDLLLLHSLKAQLNRKNKMQKANEKSAAYIRKNLAPLLSDYYALLNEDFDNEMSTQKMLEVALNPPEFDDSQLFGEKKITERYSELNQTLENLRNEEREILLKLEKLEQVTGTGSNFSGMLRQLKEQTAAANIETEEYICPLCGQEYKEISEEDTELINAAEWLDNELEITERYTADFSEDRRKLEEAHEKIKEKIRNIWKQIKELEKRFIFSKTLVSKREKVNYAKAKIQLYAEMSATGVFETVDGDIVELKEKIARLQEKIDGFDVQSKMAEAQAFLSANMNKLAETLDFEEEYKPIDLNFELLDESFDIYQRQNGKQKIHLYEMGSGANWVSCHIALFLSFLHYFAMQEKSPMPLTMFFDQPSQVYFPHDSESANEMAQADMKAVNKMYQTIFDEINKIGAETGILPQIIIVDHVDGNNLECKDEFQKYVRCNWRMGNALI